MCRHLFIALVFFAAPVGTIAQVAVVEHVVVIGCDGLSPDGVQKAKAPVMKHMMKQGAWTFNARGVLPTSSSPNWTSMITGVGPEQHGITSNDWQINRYRIEPLVRGPHGIFPTIFGTLREQRPSAVIGCFHDWSYFSRLVERPVFDVLEDSEGPTDAINHATQFILTRKPALTFIHLDHVDQAGHKSGYASTTYLQSVEVADQLIGRVVRALESSQMMDRSIILVTSDHGGVGKNHGNATMAELEIPWIIYGRGIKSGYEIKTPVNTYDTAVTLAHVLGLTPHPVTIGKAVKEAFIEPPPMLPLTSINR